jgi:hypothetical protein
MTYNPSNPPEDALRGKLNPPLFIWLLIIASALIGSFQIYTFYIQAQNTNNNSANQIKNKSGIMGQVTIGPVCPVERIPPDPQCADKTYQASLRIKNQVGKIVLSTKTNADGTFKFDLPAGQYTIENASTAVMPTLSPVEVVVDTNKYTEINLQFDSGIR